MSTIKVDGLPVRVYGEVGVEGISREKVMGSIQIVFSFYHSRNSFFLLSFFYL